MRSKEDKAYDAIVEAVGRHDFNPTVLATLLASLDKELQNNLMRTLVLLIRYWAGDADSGWGLYKNQKSLEIAQAWRNTLNRKNLRMPSQNEEI